ncbi:MAG: hypothetical protein MZU97_24865 [Bacillus subtilis]|nr:hypothetical protein [Bacillus subtilis]
MNLWQTSSANTRRKISNRSTKAISICSTTPKKSKSAKRPNNRRICWKRFKAILASEVKDVKLSTRLTDSPVCLVSGDGLSFEMEKVMNQMPGEKAMKAEKILEINPKHELFAAIEQLHQQKEPLDDYAWILYNQASVDRRLDNQRPRRVCEQNGQTHGQIDSLIKK